MGIWVTLFLPAFLGGICLGASVMAVFAKAAIKKTCKARPQKSKRPALAVLENCA